MQVHIEERLRHDAQRQILHLMSEIALLVRRPGVEHLSRVLDHNIGVAVYALLVEGRLNEAALLAVKVAVGREEPVAEQASEVARELTVGEVARLLGKEVANMFWPREKDDWLRAHFNRRRFAIRARHRCDE